MIKKVVLFFVCVALLVSSVRAQEIGKPVEQMSVDEILNLMKQPAKNEQIFVQMLFSIPPEYHQYVMPMVGNMFGISEKVRMMPGIVEWRRKLPTRIAPQLEEYAKEHLRYLHPAFYPYLMPEAWPDTDASEHTHKTEFIPRSFLISSAEEMERAFPSGINPNSISGRILNGTWKVASNDKQGTSLTKSDVASVVTVLEQLKALEEGEEGRKRRDIIIMNYQQMQPLIEAHVNPCASLISHLDQIDKDKWFAEQVAAQKMTVDEFARKCDALIKAYRMYISPPGVILAISDLQEDVKDLPEDSYRRQLVSSLWKMFTTSKDDVDALDGQEEVLGKIFREKLLFLGTPVLLDF